MNIFIFVRAITYATVFIGLLFIYLPGRLLAWSGIIRPAVIETPQVAGMIVGGLGAALALWCIITFAFIGPGTPAPFDPPRRLVIRGPYRFVRNPMYIGAGLGLSGAAIFYGSISMAIYAGLFLLATHLFVVFYEETTLQRTFGSDYEAYCRRVSRWWPVSISKQFPQLGAGRALSRSGMTWQKLDDRCYRGQPAAFEICCMDELTNAIDEPENQRESTYALLMRSEEKVATYSRW